ncbi:MAG: TrkA C-terminal domain-containing protein [Microbacterium sp.]
MPAHVERADLPGIGVRHDILTDEGRRVSVINFRDGGRELALADEDDPDRASETIVLTDDEATALSEVLGGSLILTQLAGLRDQLSGLYMEQIPVRADSPFVGRPLGDTKARTRTRCSIVAIVRDSGVLPAPEPADKLGSGDMLVAVGTREGLDMLVRIITTG